MCDPDTLAYQIPTRNPQRGGCASSSTWSGEVAGGRAGDVDTAVATDSRTVNEVAFDRLRELILSGALAMGDRLDERSLSTRMHVSRTPLREAIVRMANLGVVEQRPYRGAFLRTFDRTQVAELYEVRKVLEGLAARKATTAITDAQLTALATIIDRGTAALSGQDTEGFEAADREFHAFVVSVAGSALLSEQLRHLELRIQLVRHLANLQQDVAAHTVDDRLEVYEAMVARDPAGAEMAMIQHIAAVEAEALRRLPASTDGSTSA